MPNSSKSKRFAKITSFIAFLAVVTIGWQNCSKSPNMADYSNGNASSASTSPSVTVEQANPATYSVQAGGTFNITYNWSSTGPLSSDLTAIVNIETSTGATVAQDNHSPNPATSQWSGVISYTRTVTVPASVAAGTYSIWAGLCDSSGSSCMQLTAGANVTDANQLYKIATLTVTAPPPPPPPPPPTINLTASTCRLTFSHCDTNCTGYTGTKYSTTAALDSSSGFARLSMADYAGDTSAVVNSDDIFFLKGNSCSTTSTDVDSYIAGCSVSLGAADVNGTLPTYQMTMPAFNNSEVSTHLFSPTDTVNSDDRMFIRMNCPAAANSNQDSMATYVKNNCYICLGMADSYGTTPSKARCARVGNTTDSMTDPSKWAGINFPAGDTVNYDDSLFVGFYCKNYPTIGSPFVWVPGAKTTGTSGTTYPMCDQSPCSSPGATGTCELITYQYYGYGITVPVYSYYASTCGLNPSP